MGGDREPLAEGVPLGGLGGLVVRDVAIDGSGAPVGGRRGTTLTCIQWNPLSWTHELRTPLIYIKDTLYEESQIYTF